MKIFQIQEDFEGDRDGKKYVEIANLGMLQPFNKNSSQLDQILEAAKRLRTDERLVFSSTERTQIVALGHMAIGSASFGQERDDAEFLINPFLMLKHLTFIYIPSDEADNPIFVLLKTEKVSIRVKDVRNVLAVGRTK